LRLGLELERHADLVAALLEVLAVDQRRQGEGDAWREKGKQKRSL
jgi:hypothetical protein